MFIIKYYSEIQEKQKVHVYLYVIISMRKLIIIYIWELNCRMKMQKL